MKSHAPLTRKQVLDWVQHVEHHGPYKYVDLVNCPNARLHRAYGLHYEVPRCDPNGSVIERVEFAAFKAHPRTFEEFAKLLRKIL